ncbi:phosphorylase [Thermaurantimonas aggregans]|uniref:Phosphorylase n=1 Tax=Thermaurantimonas aggregans TaxID=2173829 RepID=A0A401XLT0_9FLAO|nr:nucleoside phosphorylase [Thermaurantimonas aggregans]MCX8147787.1 nucleoside phosphorylase [Thermaurantimonas aggregans]GCD77963.1 phosphorylase [Thermaurantimonas aggregans]
MQNLAEIILNDDGSIYHLHLKPEEITEIVITVGDPDRVDKVAGFFESVKLTRQHREFRTITGTYRGRPITVVSTGIGTDNVDIVLNELDMLANVLLPERVAHPFPKSLIICRMGTSGAIRPDIKVGTLLVSEEAWGIDGLHAGYDFGPLTEIQPGIYAYHTRGDAGLISEFQKAGFTKGITLTTSGFYGPQGRSIRIPSALSWLRSESGFVAEKGLTNLEMETAGIYALSALLGHRAISLNAILANRITGEFSPHPDAVMEELILRGLDVLSRL